jgi:catechol 2,3-dioxygenase-like lactoylglutathione lyase family enzyme
MSTTRIQLALNVSDVAEATAFYEKMFGVPPITPPVPSLVAFSPCHHSTSRFPRIRL